MRNPGNRWELVWSHREELLEIARRRSSSAEDAEDAVQEAMTRAVEDRSVPFGRVGPWLRGVTVRLCADRHRQVAREGELSARTALVPASPDPVEDMVCDRAEARWLADRSADVLPPHQAEALRLRSQGFDVGQVARQLGLSYRAAESSLARARRTVRAMTAGVLSLAATVWLFTRRLPHTGADRSAVATSTAVTVAVMTLALPVGPVGHQDGQRPGDSRAGTASRSAPEAVHPAPRTTPEAAARPLPPDPASSGPRPTAAARKPPGPAIERAAAAVRDGTLTPVLRSAATAVPSLPSDASGVRPPAVPTKPAVSSVHTLTGTGGPAGLPLVITGPGLPRT